MSTNPDLLEDQLEKYEAQLKGIKSYINELHDTTNRHGTGKDAFEADLFEAEHNVQYYEAEISRVEKELQALKGAPQVQAAADSVLPQTVKQGLGSLLFSSASFLAGAFLGSRLKGRRGNKEKREGE